MDDKLIEILEQQRTEYKRTEKTIAILIQRSEAQYYNACVESLQGINCPEGYEIELHTLEKTENFAAAMNEVRANVHAKYKIYIDARMYLIAPDFLQNIIDIFQDKSIGLIGFLGCQSLPFSGNIMESRHKCGRVYMPGEDKVKEYVYPAATDAPVSDVCYVLPSLFATQYDIEWDARYTGAYYATMVQCRKYEAQRCRIVVPTLPSAWCAYQSDELLPWDLERERVLFLQMYYPYLTEEDLADRTRMTLYACGGDTEIPGWRVFSHPEGIYVGSRTQIHTTAICGLHLDNFEELPRIVIGRDCSVGAYSTISAVNRVEIGSSVRIAEGVRIADYVYDHRNLCLPSHHRQLADPQSTVVIGRGTSIEENVVIRGNVHIGRGCRIRAGCVIDSDFPDYVVVGGQPARVEEAFSAKSGTWVAVADEEELKKILRERREIRPIFSYAIPSYNRAKYLRKSLTCVLEQLGNDELVEVCVSDNASEDDTQEIIRQFQAKYKNLRCHRHPETIEANKNIQAAVRMTRGEYVVAAGDDDYVADGILYTLIDHLYRHRDKAIVCLKHVNHPTFHLIYEGEGCVDYLHQVSFYTTLISGIVMKRSLYDAVDNPEKYTELCLTQVYIQMEMLKKNPAFSVIFEPIWRADSGEYDLVKGNLIQIFVKNYLDILTATVDFPADALSEEKRRLMEGMIVPECRRIRLGGLKMDVDGVAAIIRKYYADEAYYSEVVTVLKDILGDAYR